MIRKRQKVEKFLNYLLIFLLPTQLAAHFWPASAFVFGIRVDYLAPAVYLTDVIFIALFLLWVVGAPAGFVEFIRKHKLILLAVILTALINILFSTSFWLTLYKWAKILEFGAFAFYVWARREVFIPEKIFKILFFSMVFFSLLGIAQFVLGRTVGGPFYLFGERNFNIATPGIALAQFFGQSFLRAYSSFSHPNSFAGYLAAATLVSMDTGFKKTTGKKIFGLLIISCAFLLTFSLSAIVGVVFCFVIYAIFRRKILSGGNVGSLVAVFFLLSLFLTLVSGTLLKGGVYSQSVSQRLQLAFASGKIISEKFWTGTGLNTFIPNGTKTFNGGSYVWLLQPVHNIYLLTFSETGVFGAVLLYVFFAAVLKAAIAGKKTGALLAIIFIMTTGLFDHYWATLQQNMFLLALISAYSFRRKS